jgi:hypothetical protein
MKEQVEETEYLGTITVNGKTDREINNRVQKQNKFTAKKYKK